MTKTGTISCLYISRTALNQAMAACLPLNISGFHRCHVTHLLASNRHVVGTEMKRVNIWSDISRDCLTAIELVVRHVCDRILFSAGILLRGTLNSIHDDNLKHHRPFATGARRCIHRTEFRRGWPELRWIKYQT